MGPEWDYRTSVTTAVAISKRFTHNLEATTVTTGSRGWGISRSWMNKVNLKEFEPFGGWRTWT